MIVIASSAIEVASSVLPEEITRAPVLLGILVGRQQVEGRHDFTADRGDGTVWDDENEVVAADVPDEAVLAARPLHHVVEKLCQDADYAIPLVVAVPIVEFLKVIEIGVADRERVAEREPSSNFCFNR